ncbi:S-DNA-T family DNA segregation ATPase FtsK/SpoIIIE [Streptomyces sp. TLI_235]|nr:FtsK/SpoIIIE domain-containing protein [Streptomyces sp. TLI_235]PBC77575.1 S-DNA-T family DNA segregation ATPase FtsK/SpoIIIE [Streptomyces sp. TLI_235]
MSEHTIGPTPGPADDDDQSVYAADLQAAFTPEVLADLEAAMRGLEGDQPATGTTVIPKPAAPVLDMTKAPTPAEPARVIEPTPDEIVLGGEQYGITLREDPEGDLPFVPLWVRSAGGWKFRTRVARVQARRAVRRWLARQRTTRGHGAQFRRGLRITTEWVGGLEGANMDAARTQAYMAARESRQLARAARFKAMPSTKAKARAEADRAQTAAIAAANTYKRAKADRTRARLTRGTIAYGPAVAALGYGYVAGGLPGLGAAASATFAGGAFVGRRPDYADESWGGEFEYLGDGVPLTEPLLNRVFVAAKVIAENETLRMVTPCMSERDGAAWLAMFDLPPGITVRKALAASEALASAFGVEVAQLDMAKAGRAGRIDLRVANELPFTGTPERGPLLAHEGPVNFWEKVPMATSVRGLPVLISWVERSGLLGGEPGAGKSAAANNVLLAAALDPRVILWLADGKGGGDLEPFDAIATETEPDGDPEAMLAMLRRLKQEMAKRYAFLKSIGKRKVTEELANKYPQQLRQLLFYVDELMSYLTDDEKLGKQIAKMIRLIVSKGRAAGIITIAATQKPGSDVVPTSLRDILSIRFALRCLTPQASDTILGQGAAAAGYNAKAIEAEMRGAGYLWAEGSNPLLVRAHFYKDEEVTALLERAHALREAAGTLPSGEMPLPARLRGLGTAEGNALAVLVEAFEEYDRARTTEDGEEQAEDPTEWLPTAYLVEALTKAGIALTEKALGDLVRRSAEQAKRRDWEGRKTSGYPVEAIMTAASKALAPAA